MRRLSLLLWFLLVPYFAVLRLNVPAGIGLSREFTNRSNARLILALILVCPLILLSPKTGPLADAIQAHVYIFAFLVLVPAWWLVSAWLKGDRERRYAAAYRSLSQWQRFAFGLTTPALLVTALVLTASNTAAKRTGQLQSSDLSCDHSATEMTADACTTKSR
jgi:hypothetical protein